MEITWYGETCLRVRGREGVVATDAYRSVVGPTGRGLTADISTYSHADTSEPPKRASKAGKTAGQSTKSGAVIRPTSLEPAFYLDAPGEFEVHEVLFTGVRTFRDESQGAERGVNTCFVMELDGIHTVHLGDIGHMLDEDIVGEIGSVEVVCVPIGSALSASKAAEVVAQLDAKLVVPMPVGPDESHARSELDRFLREMSVQQVTPVSKLSVSISTVPQETTVVVLEARGRV